MAYFLEEPHQMLQGQKEASLPGCEHAEAGMGWFRELADWYGTLQELELAIFMYFFFSHSMVNRL